MGAWGHSAFENDDALDWAGMFVDAPEGEGSDETPGRQSLLIGPLVVAAGVDDDDDDDDDDADGDADADDDDEAEGDGYLEAPDASAAVAAAELVAALYGKPSAELAGADADSTIGALHEWSRRGLSRLDPTIAKSAALRELALQAVDAVLTSELADLWDDTELSSEWRVSLDDLRTRLTL